MRPSLPNPLVALVLMGACAGDAGVPDANLPPDAGESLPDSSEPICETCSITAQIGCQTNERCSVIWESTDPLAGRVNCVADGVRALGESCAISEFGIDDCEDGLLCWEFIDGDPRCAEICSTANGDSCTSGTCVLITDPIECFDETTTGVCMP